MGIIEKLLARGKDNRFVDIKKPSLWGLGFYHSETIIWQF